VKKTGEIYAEAGEEITKEPQGAHRGRYTELPLLYIDHQCRALSPHTHVATRTSRCEVRAVRHLPLGDASRASADARHRPGDDSIACSSIPSDNDLSAVGRG